LEKGLAEGEGFEPSIEL